VKLDKKDQQLIFELDQNSRQSINSIAKKTKLSRDVVNYRIKQLEKKKIINGYFALIDFNKLGYQAIRLYHWNYQKFFGEATHTKKFGKHSGNRLAI
jgi:DNA-binding Lrp family transcriptional regulator